MESAVTIFESEWKNKFSEYYIWYTRVWGIITTLVLWGIGIEVANDTELIGFYIVAVAALMSLLETIFLVHLLVSEYENELGRPCKVFWSYLLWIDNWKKGVLYIALSIFCLIHNFVMHGEAWLSIIAGTMLVLAGMFYLMKTLTRNQLSINILNQRQNTAYSRIDNSGDSLGSGSINNDIPASGTDDGPVLISSRQNVAEQAEIMEA